MPPTLQVAERLVWISAQAASRDHDIAALYEWCKQEGIFPFMPVACYRDQSFVGVYREEDAARIIAWMEQRGIQREDTVPKSSWNPNLFKRIDMNPRTSPFSNRVRGRFDAFRVTHIVDLLLIYQIMNAGRYYIKHRPLLHDGGRRELGRASSGSLWLECFGQKCHAEVKEILRTEYDIEDTPNLDQFPWEDLE